ncbi:hypothetical protein EZ449_01045 [Pedobacter frigidisoli]|uniref:Haem-binding uptake, Tiki superfamily, ChaN n=1 Tax=Pedobacter frigidisoli TaxID=2530455 RepID=A0A4R0P6U3_9SPHI|nr:DUF5694 domain-containing protein [Pedobacter frigidisoli]TCD12661.1 hypothetical protein EZ449_01045 [Pedobacter frigidisoli]
MKTILNLSFAFLLLIAGAVKSNAQNQIEIVIVGSSHDNSKSTQNFQAIIDKLKNFKPDMVFGEYLPAEDYAKLDSINYGKRAFQKKYDYIQKLNPKTSKNIPSEIKKDQKALSSFPFYHQTRMNLAVDYAKNWDRGNADYQIFVLENYMKDKFGKEEQAAYTKMFGGSDSLKKVGLFRPNSEYNKIFFPLIYELKQDRIYNMDCQNYDEPWNEAWGKMDTLYKAMLQKAKLDSTSQEAATVKAMDEYWKFTPEESKAFNADVYAGLNSEKYGKLDEAWNLYGGRHFYGAPGFPTDALKDMVAQWILRNEGMCKNIIDQAVAKKAKRVVVGVGASHRIWMEEILAKNPNVKIVNYNDLK